MKNPVNLPCSPEAASMIIGNHGYSGYGHYIKLLQLIFKMPDKMLKKDHVPGLVNATGMEQFIVESLLENSALFSSDQTRYMPIGVKVIHKENVDKLITSEIPPEHPLQLYVINGEGPVQFQRVKTLEKQLSVEECKSLVREFPKLLIKEMLLAMEGWGKLTASKSQGGKTSVYLTLMVWCRKEMKNGWFPNKVESKIRATA